MKVFENVCNCRLCSGGQPTGWTFECGNPAKAADAVCPCGKFGQEHLFLIAPDGTWYSMSHIAQTGGRHPKFIYLEPGEEAVRLTAHEAATYRPGDGEASFPASVHGCHKVVKHQLLVVKGVRT